MTDHHQELESRVAAGSPAARPRARHGGRHPAAVLGRAVARSSYLQLDDVVVTDREVPGRRPVTIAGVVTQVRARHEGAQFDSDVFPIADGMLPAQVQEAAEITTTRVEPEIYVPPTPGRAGAPRHRRRSATSALYFDRHGAQGPDRARPRRRAALPQRRLPRRHPRRARVHLRHLRRRDEDELRHVPALLGVPLRRARASARQRQGADLQRQGRGPALPRPPQHPARRRRSAPSTPRSACPPGRSRRSRSTRPPVPGDTTGRPTSPAALTGVARFYWTLQEFCTPELLPYVFADADDERQQYTMVVHTVAAAPAPATRQPAGPTAASRSTASRCRTLRATSSTSSSSQLTDDDDRRDWAGPVTGIGTVNAFVRRLRGQLKALSPADPRRPARPRRAQASTPRDAQVTVVDLHNLPDRAQRFVVGVMLNAEFERKEKAGTAKPLLFVVLDELNKYAPREGYSPDQGGAARHRRARPLARRHPDRRAADRQRGGAAHRRQLGDPGRRPARPGRGRPPGVRLPAAGAAAAGAARQARHDVRQPAARSRCRWLSSSRSRPGRPGRPSAAPRRRFPAGPHRRTRSPGCRSTTTTRTVLTGPNADGQPAGSDDPVRSSPVFSRRARRRLRPRRRGCCGSRTPTEADRPACSPPPRHL